MFSLPISGNMFLSGRGKAGRAGSGSGISAVCPGKSRPVLDEEVIIIKVVS